MAIGLDRYQPAPPQSQGVWNGGWALADKLVKNEFRALNQAVQNSIDWMRFGGLVSADANGLPGRVYHTAGVIDSAHGCIDLVGATNRLVNTTTSPLKRAQAALQVGIAVGDIATCASKVTTVAQRFMTPILGAASGCLVLDHAVTGIKAMVHLVSGENGGKIGLRLAKLIRSVAYVALGAFLLAPLFLGPVPAIWLTAATTVALTMTLLRFYLKNSTG